MRAHYYVFKALKHIDLKCSALTKLITVTKH